MKTPPASSASMSSKAATDIVARCGGEAFVLLLPHTTLAQAAVKAKPNRAALDLVKAGGRDRVVAVP